MTEEKQTQSYNFWRDVAITAAGIGIAVTVWGLYAHAKHDNEMWKNYRIESGHREVQIQKLYDENDSLRTRLSDLESKQNTVEQRTRTLTDEQKKRIDAFFEDDFFHGPRDVRQKD